jgi:hypothetical protein
VESDDVLAQDPRQLSGVTLAAHEGNELSFGLVK